MSNTIVGKNYTFQKILKKDNYRSCFSHFICIFAAEEGGPRKQEERADTSKGGTKKRK